MTQAHIAALLPTQNRVLSADENTAFLAHYDLNEHDVLRNVKAMGEAKSPYLNNTHFHVSGDHYSITNTVTLTAWVYPTEIPSSDRGAIIIGYGTAGGYYLTIDSTYHLSAYWHGKTPAGYHSTTGTCPINQWTHIAAVWTETELRLYLNGELDKTVTTTGSGIAPLHLHLGAENNSTNRSFKGRLRHVGVWAIDKSQTEIKKIMNEGLDERSLRAFWKMNEGSGTILRDFSPFHTDLTPRAGNFNWSTGNSIFTLRKKEGYFGGNAIAVEEGTINLSKHSTANPTVPSGYYVIGNTAGGMNLETPYTYATHTAMYSNDVPPQAQEKRSIEFTHSTTADPSGWFGTGITPVIGKSYTFSCWIKFLDADASTYSATNFGFKQHSPGAIYNSWIPNCKQNQWTYITSTYTATTSTTNSHLLIFDSITRGHRVRFCDFQIEEKSFPTSFVDGIRSVGSLKYPNPIPDATEFTISFWVKRIGLIDNRDSIMCIQTVGQDNDAIYFDIFNEEMRAFMYLTSGGTALTTKAGVDFSSWNHVVATATQQALNFYINGVKVATAAVGGAFKIKGILSLGERNSASYQDYGNFLYDELRIDSIARTDEEIAAWYYCNSPFWPRGIYRKSY